MYFKMVKCLSVQVVKPYKTLKCYYYSTSIASSSEGEKIARREISSPCQHAPSTGMARVRRIARRIAKRLPRRHVWELQGGPIPASECDVLETGISDSQAESGGPPLLSPGGLPFHTLLLQLLFPLPFASPNSFSIRTYTRQTRPSWLMTFTNLLPPAFFPSTEGKKHHQQQQNT